MGRRLRRLDGLGCLSLPNIEQLLRLLPPSIVVRDLEETLDILDGRRPLAEGIEHRGAIEIGCRQVGIDGDAMIEVLARPHQIALYIAHRAAIETRGDHIRIDGDRSVQIRDGLGIALELAIGLRTIGQHSDIVRLKRRRSIEILQGRCYLPLLQQDTAAHGIEPRLIRIATDGRGYRVNKYKRLFLV